MKELKQLRKAGLHVVEYAPLFRWGYFVFAYSQEHGETLHTVFAFCSYVNVNVERELANETFCYLLDWLFGEGVKGNCAVFRSGLEEPGGK